MIVCIISSVVAWQRQKQNTSLAKLNVSVLITSRWKVFHKQKLWPANNTRLHRRPVPCGDLKGGLKGIFAFSKKKSLVAIVARSRRGAVQEPVERSVEESNVYCLPSFTDQIKRTFSRRRIWLKMRIHYVMNNIDFYVFCISCIVVYYILEKERY